MSNKRTPWGDAQHEKEIAPGVVFYMTAGHGGYKVEKNVRQTWHQTLQDFVPFNDNHGWYEEDCDWMIVALAMPHLFPSFPVESAKRIAKDLSKDSEKWAAVYEFASQI